MEKPFRTTKASLTGDVDALFAVHHEEIIFLRMDSHERIAWVRSEGITPAAAHRAFWKPEP